MNVGQAELSALVLERQAFVINSHQVQDGGVQVVDVDRVLGDVVAERIGLSVGCLLYTSDAADE